MLGESIKMSHAIRRGSPTTAQLFLDKLLDEILTAKNVTPDVDGRKNISLTEIIFYCLKKNPTHLFIVSILVLLI